MKRWQFEALDSLFFRGAKSFNQGESGFLDSQFPPTAQTMAGVIRAAIAESMGVNWEKFREGEQPEIADVIGKSSNDAGQLCFAGSYIHKDGQRLYPVPLHLLYNAKTEQWGKLQPAKDYLKTDMGDKRLPKVVESSAEGAKPLENAWLTEDNFKKALQGNNPTAFVSEDDLICYENRVGIGRNNETRKTVEGMLYFTRHLRLKKDISLAMDVKGADHIEPAKMLRLGGEGRMANVSINQAADSHLRENIEAVNTAMLVLLTHGDFDGKPEPELEGVHVVSACIGKAVREGGWDYKHGRPKPLKSLVPAGSVYFVEGDISKLGTSIGKRTTFGYGEIAIGIWEDK